MLSNFSELWKVSGVLYKEIVLQSVLSRNPLATTNRKIEDIVKTVNLNMWFNKILLCIMLCIMAIAPIMNRSAINITIFLAMIVFLFIFLGIQTVTSFVASNFNYLRILPLGRDEISLVNLMTFFRLFDLPLVMLIIFFPLAIFVTTFSPLHAILAFIAVVVSEVFSLAILICLARLFHSKIAHSTSGSRWRGLLKFLYIMTWSLPAFGFYFIARFAVDISEISSRYSGVISSHYGVLSFIFPFCFGFLIRGSVSLQLLGSCAVYILLAVFALKWLLSAINEISSGTVRVARDNSIRSQNQTTSSSSWYAQKRSEVDI